MKHLTALLLVTAAVLSSGCGGRNHGYKFSKPAKPGPSKAVITGVAPGTYVVAIYDANGNIIGYQIVVIP